MACKESSGMGPRGDLGQRCAMGAMGTEVAFSNT